MKAFRNAETQTLKFLLNEGVKTARAWEESVATAQQMVADAKVWCGQLREVLAERETWSIHGKEVPLTVLAERFGFPTPGALRAFLRSHPRLSPAEMMAELLAREGPAPCVVTES